MKLNLIWLWPGVPGITPWCRKTLPRWTEQVRVTIGTVPEGPLDDGYSWRKYGQKDILGANFPRWEANSLPKLLAILNKIQQIHLKKISFLSKVSNPFRFVTHPLIFPIYSWPLLLSLGIPQSHPFCTTDRDHTYHQKYIIYRYMHTQVLKWRHSSKLKKQNLNLSADKHTICSGVGSNWREWLIFSSYLTHGAQESNSYELSLVVTTV